MSGAFVSPAKVETPDHFTGVAAESFVRASVLALLSLGARVTAQTLLTRVRRDHPNHRLDLLKAELVRAMVSVTKQHHEDCCLLGDPGDFSTMQIERTA